MRTVDIIVPVFNEQENIGCLVNAIRQIFAKLNYNYRLIIVDDGSKDNTFEVIKAFASTDPRINYISFSRNFGHQNALKAGLDKSIGDCAISLDGDMQHPPELIPSLLGKWEEGYDVVYTIRQEGGKVGRVKRTTSGWFYKVMNIMSEVKMEEGTADFRLVSKKVVDVLRDFTEHELFFRGLVKWMGFSQVGIEYVPNERTWGRSKYTLHKMIRFALQGITSFSTKPLYVAAYLGFFFSLATLLYLPYALFSYYFGSTISGWTSVIVTIAFFGGLQLCILGIIGLYLGKVFMQVKHRPLYIIKETSLA
ncbi:MAG: glycosyl transferase family 2 [Segetibacter sp.]|nr:glycosyl transferase family 2 [Segetibacter sp.]